MLQVIQFLLLFAAISAAPKNLPQLNRLPDSVKPTKYTLGIKLDEDFVTTRKYTGTVDIVVDVASLEEKIIQLNSHKSLTITSVKIDKENLTSNFDLETEFLVIKLADQLADGSHTISISYTGPLRDDKVGIYLGSYIDQFQLTRNFVATQFEEIHARKAFPCFDEPQMKAVFSLKLTYPKKYQAISNNIASSKSSQGNFFVTSFRSTKKMSTYLLAFVISEMNCKAGGEFYKSPIQLCSRIPPQDHSAEFALELIPQIHDFMAAVTQHNYSASAQFTLAALPEFAPGAMENWGLVTFKESNLLIGEKSGVVDRQKVVTTLSHELAHQWFGDLVTLEWWNEMFLNEGFATYFAYEIAESIEPSFQLAKQFLLEQTQPALYADSFGTSLPLSYEVTNPDYSTRINDLSYSKGASILRMMEQFVGKEDFYNALADYINENAFGSVTSAKLFQSIQKQIDELADDQKPPASIDDIMENWIKISGYPILNVEVKDDRVVITQEQFLLTKNVTTTQWYVPITYTTNFHFQDTSTKAWLTPNKPLTIPKTGSFILLNLQQKGFYRVNYDDTILQNLSEALSGNNTSIDDLTKAQLIDDQFNLVYAGRKNYTEVLQFLSFLQNDKSFYSWSVAFKHYNIILQRIADRNLRNAFLDYLKDQMMKLVLSVDFEENEDNFKTLTQILAFGWSCKLRNETCLDYYAQTFQDFVLDASKEPNADFKALVYCNGLRRSSSPASDFQFLWTRFENSDENEQLTILKTLGCVNDTTLRNHYLSLILSDPKITPENSRYVAASVYSNNPEGVDEFLEFIIDYYNSIIKKLGANYFISFVNVMASLTNSQNQIDRLNTLTKAEDLDQNVEAAIKTAINVAKDNLLETQKIESILTDLLDGKFSFDKDSSSSASITILNWLVLLFILIFNFS